MTTGRRGSPLGRKASRVLSASTPGLNAYNYAAFALAGCGARVTSVDISQRQLDVAADRARRLGLHIAFVRADAARLVELAAGTFDIVTSTNGFFV